MNHNKAFTLIELMVVVAIATIVAAIALPSYQAFARDAAVRESQAIADGFSLQLRDWLVRNKRFNQFTPEDYTGPTYYLPKGATATDYKYQLRIVSENNNTANLLSVTGVTHRNWHMYAIPNPTGNLQHADKFYLNSMGTKCRIDNSAGTASMPSDTDIIGEDCTSTLAKEW